MQNQQLPGMESRDQRGPDKKEQWLILRAADRVNATLPEIHQAQRKENKTTDFVRTNRSHGVGVGGEVEMRVQPRAALLKGASPCFPDQPVLP